MKWVKLLVCDILFDCIWSHDLLRMEVQIGCDVVESVENVYASPLSILLRRYFYHFLSPFFEVHTVDIQSLLRKTDGIILVNLFSFWVLRTVLKVLSFDLTQCNSLKRIHISVYYFLYELVWFMVTRRWPRHRMLLLSHIFL